MEKSSSEFAANDKGESGLYGIKKTFRTINRQLTIKRSKVKMNEKQKQELIDLLHLALNNAYARGVFVTSNDHATKDVIADQEERAKRALFKYIERL